MQAAERARRPEWARQAPWIKTRATQHVWRERVSVSATDRCSYIWVKIFNSKSFVKGIFNLKGSNEDVVRSCGSAQPERDRWLIVKCINIIITFVQYNINAQIKITDLITWIEYL